MYIIDHTVAFAIDAPIKASHIQQIDQNIDELHSRVSVIEGGGITQIMLGYTVGDVLLISSDVNSAILTTATLTVLKEAKVSRSGSLRIKFTMVHGWTSGALQITGQIYRVRGGTPTAVGTLRTMVGTDPDTEYSEDISGWAPGDLVQIKCTAYNADHSCMIKNFRIYTAYYQLDESITVP